MENEVKLAAGAVVSLAIATAALVVLRPCSTPWPSSHARQATFRTWSATC